MAADFHTIVAETLYVTARQSQMWRLRTKIVTKFMSYVLQTPCLQKPENSRIVKFLNLKLKLQCTPTAMLASLTHPCSGAFGDLV
jgi:hypothetical protein